MSVPRIRGDDPHFNALASGFCVVFPAYAGMIPSTEAPLRNADSVPRIRGDDPWTGALVLESRTCSPHTRG